MLFAVYVVAVAVVAEVVVAGFDGLTRPKIIIIFALAMEALVLTEAVVAHALVSIAIGPFTV